MLLYDLIENCSYRDEFQSEHEQCEDCSYGECCPRDCQNCLQYVYYPQNAPAPRKSLAEAWMLFMRINHYKIDEKHTYNTL